MQTDFLLAKLNDEQRTACTSTGNTVTAAGAGSGKTTVLATRFAWLVMEKNIPVDRILTLTFTKKATTEMYGRIYSTLRAVASAADDIPAAIKERAKRAVDHFADANIQTLDSFNTKIVRLAASRYGIRPDFTPGDTSLVRQTKSLALDFVLGHRNSVSVRSLSEPGHIEDLANKLFADTVITHTTVAADSGTYFSSQLGLQRKAIAHAWNKTSKDIVSILEQIREEYESLPTAKKAQPYGLTLSGALEADEPELPEISTESVATEQGRNAVVKYCSWLASFRFSQRLAGFTRPLQALFKALKPLLEELDSIREFFVQYPVIAETFGLLDAFLYEVNAVKRSTGLLSFADVSELALKILCEQKDIRQLEKSSYDAVMIDEFQDNNAKNKSLLYLLSERNDMISDDIPQPGNLEKNKLFFVGDEKQSIYRFRGADVSVFNTLASELGGQKKYLRTNYRSSPQLTAAYNQIFGGFMRKGDSYIGGFPSVFPQQSGTDYEACYPEQSIALSPSDSKDKGTEESPVRLCLYDTRQSDESDSDPISREETEACFTARKIRNILDGNIRIPGMDNVREDDIAILLKATTHQTEYEKQLRLSGIPYVSEKLVSFFNEAPVNDLYNFLRLCVYPSDTTAYASLLTSPFVSMTRESAETAIAIATGYDGNKYEKTSGELFGETDTQILGDLLSPNEFRKFTRAATLYKNEKDKALSGKVTETVNELWYKLGYRYETMWNKAVSVYGEQYDLLFETARIADENSKGIAWFVDELAVQKKNSNASWGNEQDMELDTNNLTYPVERAGAVHIMTIHRSKGLEFPIVFIGGISKKRNFGIRNTESVFCSDDGTLSLNTGSGNMNYFFSRQKKETEARQTAELRRLLYVAVTRAEKAVYLTGSWDGTAEQKNPAANFFSLLAPLMLFYSQDTSPAPYVEEEIPYYTRKQANSPYTGKPDTIAETTRNNRTEAPRKEIGKKQTFIKKNMPLYASANPITPETVTVPYVSPSSLEVTGPEIETDEVLPLYPEINEIVAAVNGKELLNKTRDSDSTTAAGNSDDAKQSFGFNNFGTIAHVFMQANANGIAAMNVLLPQREIAGLTGKKGEKYKQQIRDICCDMVRKFNESETGQRLEMSTERKVEYPFKSAVGNYIIRGTMDLVMKAADKTIELVDYKTDQTIKPERYFNQLACYRQALLAMTGIKPEMIRCTLYYLRFAETIDVTEEVKRIIVTEELLRSLLST